MSEQINFMLPADEQFDPNADQTVYDLEFYALAAREGLNDFDIVFGPALTTEVKAERLLVASDAPDTFTNNQDMDPDKSDGD